MATKTSLVRNPEDFRGKDSDPAGMTTKGGRGAAWAGEEDSMQWSSAEDTMEADGLDAPKRSSELLRRRKELAERETSDEDEDGNRRTKRGEADGGVGGCIMLMLAGKRRPFHDGCGLASSGRWEPERR
eukprot:2883346-Karenia_brevis.AAC.1